MSNGCDPSLIDDMGLHYIPNIQYILVDLELSLGTPINQPVSREDVMAFENSGERSSTCDGFFFTMSWMILHDSTCLVGRPERFGAGDV